MPPRERSPRTSALELSPPDKRVDEQIQESKPENERSPTPASGSGDTGSSDDTAVFTLPTTKGKATEDVTPTPVRKWMVLRAQMREYAAEFMGIAALVMFGTGVNCQVVLSGDPRVSTWRQGTYLSISLGWGIGLAIGGWLSTGISGGHINPAVTIAMATWRGFPWRKVPGYILAQILGSLVGSAIVYANYYQAINIVEGGTMRTGATRGLFASYAAPYMSNVGAFFDEFLGTLILMFAILVTVDKKNSPPPSGLAPLVLFMIFTGISASFGMQTGFAFNPARDLGPRLMTYMAGYGRDVWNYRRQYWIWCPIIAPIMGAQVANFFYDVFLYTGTESPAAILYLPIYTSPPGQQEQQKGMSRPAGPGADEAV